MKKILVTGGSGFIGSNFIKAYKKKYDIVAPTSEEADLTRYEDVSRLFGENKFDAVLHLAAKHDTQTISVGAADNLIMFKNVQHAAVVSGVKKMIVVGDSADADLSRPVVGFKEKDFGKTVPTSGYGLGRYLIHLLASKDKISTVLRMFGVFGSGASRSNNSITEVLASAVTGKKQIVLKGDKIISALYVEDACKIISLFLDNDYERGMYNVASPAPTSLSEFAKKAKAYAKKNGREITVEIGAEAQNELTADVSKLLDTLGSFKFTAHSTAINKTLDYYKSHKSALKEEKV